MALVKLASLTKRFGPVKAVDSLELTVNDGEFFCVLGPSGCGKTTLLRLIAGLETPDEGSIHFGHELIWGRGADIPSERRNVGVVFQSYALWPHMTVEGNASYPLKVMQIKNPQRKERVNQALAAVRMESLAARKPHELSGGQQQRVALARCLTQKPRIVLMDEPLANLDMHLRESMLNEFRHFHRNSGATIIYITHDQAEAMSIADRIAVMFNGSLVQIATPEELYEKPADAQVAGFVGLSSLLPAMVCGPGQVAIDGSEAVVQAVMANGSKPGDEVLLCVRPEEVALGDGPFKGRVRRIMYLGGRYMVELDSGQTMIKAYANARYGQGDTVSYAFMRTWAMSRGASGPGCPTRAKPPAAKMS